MTEYTGDTDADLVIARLMSADPDFDDCQDAVLLIRQLVVEIRGPDGYSTWKEAAIAERVKQDRLRGRLEGCINNWSSIDWGGSPADCAAELRELLEGENKWPERKFDNPKEDYLSGQWDKSHMNEPKVGECLSG